MRLFPFDEQSNSHLIQNSKVTNPLGIGFALQMAIIDSLLENFTYAGGQKAEITIFQVEGRRDLPPYTP